MPVTNAIAPAGVLGNDANALMPLLTTGAAAKVEPHTSTRAICIAKANRFHTPLPQCSTTSKGVWWQMGIANKAATKVSMMANMKGSGRKRCTKRTQALIMRRNIGEWRFICD